MLVSARGPPSPGSGQECGAGCVQLEDAVWEHFVARPQPNPCKSPHGV